MILKIWYNLSRWKLKIKPLLKQRGSVSHYSKVEKYSTLLIQIYFSLMTGKWNCNQLNFPGKEAKLFQLFLSISNTELTPGTFAQLAPKGWNIKF